MNVATILLLFGVSMIPMVLGILIDKVFPGMFASGTMFIYSGIQSQEPTIFGIALFVFVIATLYVSVTASQTVGVGTSG